MIMFNLGQFPKDSLSGETVFRNTNNEQRRIQSGQGHLRMAHSRPEHGCN